MILPKELTTVTRLSKLVALGMFVALPFIGFYYGVNYSKFVPTADNANLYTAVYNSTTTPTIDNKKVVVQGVIKKLKDDRDLGSDYYFNIAFDQPYLLQENGSGGPQYVTSMEVSPSEFLRQNIEDYLNKHVEVTGEEIWGYAESKLLKIETITEAK